MRLFSCLVSLLVIGATGVFAQQIRAADPQSIVSFLSEEGVDATLTKDDYDDPKIKITYDNHRFSIYFYGCEENKNCQSLQFYAGYRTQGKWTQEQANDWNKGRRYGKAYVTESGSSRLEYDIHTGDFGIHVDDFTEMFQTWLRIKTRFESAINW